MYHRIRESETSATISENIRSKEDLKCLNFWPDFSKYADEVL